MAPAEEAERAVVKRLDAQRNPVHPGPAEACEATGLHRGRIGLQRDLRRCGETEGAAGAIDDGRNQVRRHERGRAAAEEQAVERPRPDPGGDMRKLAEQRRLPAGGIDLVADMAVEVAIRAFGQAEWPVHIKPEARRGRALSGGSTH
jgi:hypothetical protein